MQTLYRTKPGDGPPAWLTDAVDVLVLAALLLAVALATLL